MLQVSTSPNPQFGVPIPSAPITLGYDSARIVGPVSGGVETVTVPITLSTDARYTDTTKDNQIFFDSFNDSVVPGSESVTSGGNPLPPCPSTPSTTACVRFAGDNNRGGSCISARIDIDQAQPSTTYSLMFKETQPNTCGGSVKPGLRISAAPQGPPTTTLCDLLTDCSVTYTGDKTLGTVIYSVGAHQVTSMDVGHEEDYVVQYPPTRESFPSRGAFVIGDGVASTGNHVNWWGNQWATTNALTGGPPPDTFKGFDGGDQPSSCAGTWTDSTGNAGNPPPTVPADMLAIVSSHVTQTGSTTTGDVLHIVVVHTDPGYQPNPGHPGTGTVTQQIC